MNLAKLFIVSVVIVALFSIVQISAAADEAASFNASVGIRENLQANVGKKVSLRISAGEAIEGTIAKVGDQAVQISKLTGKDFYDAIIRIDRIEAIIYKAR